MSADYHWPGGQAKGRDRECCGGEVKARSSRWIHETFPKLREASWQRGYGGFTVSRSAIDEVDRYIREQQSHHERLSFKDEFEALLRKHCIEFDARYVLE